MDWKREWKSLAGMAAIFAGFYWLPVESLRLSGPLMESLALTRWYAREHVLLCLVPAFFIAGAISVFVRRDSVMKYLGPRANKALAYGVASVSARSWRFVPARCCRFSPESTAWGRGLARPRPFFTPARRSMCWR